MFGNKQSIQKCLAILGSSAICTVYTNTGQLRLRLGLRHALIICYNSMLHK